MRPNYVGPHLLFMFMVVYPNERLAHERIFDTVLISLDESRWDGATRRFLANQPPLVRPMIAVQAL